RHDPAPRLRPHVEPRSPDPGCAAPAREVRRGAPGGPGTDPRPRRGEPRARDGPVALPRLRDGRRTGEGGAADGAVPARRRPLPRPDPRGDPRADPRPPGGHKAGPARPPRGGGDPAPDPLCGPPAPARAFLTRTWRPIPQLSPAGGFR